MKLMIGIIPISAILLSLGQAQVCPTSSLQPTPLEAFAHLPATHVAWSNEVGQINSKEDRAIIMAVVLEDTAHPPDRMRGVRIDLSGRDAQDEVYLGEETLSAFRDALDEISREAARQRSAHTSRDGVTPGGTAFLGARLFWYGDNVPRVHTLNAAYYFAPDSSGLVLSAFKRADFRFPDEDPALLSAAIVRALDQLKKH